MFWELILDYITLSITLQIFGELISDYITSAPVFRLEEEEEEEDDLAAEARSWTFFFGGGFFGSSEMPRKHGENEDFSTFPLKWVL